MALFDSLIRGFTASNPILGGVYDMAKRAASLGQPKPPTQTPTLPSVPSSPAPVPTAPKLNINNRVPVPGEVSVPVSSLGKPKVAVASSVPKPPPPPVNTSSFPTPPPAPPAPTPSPSPAPPTLSATASVPETYKAPEYAAPSDANLRRYQEEYLRSLQMSPEEQAAQEQLNNLIASKEMGVAEVRDKPIPMQFITGQSRALEERAAAQAVPLSQRLALEQAKRELSAQRAGAQTTFEQQRYQTELERAQKEREKALSREEKEKTALTEAQTAQSKPIEVGGNLLKFNPTSGKYESVYSAAQKPIELSEGATLYDPTTGKPLYTAPKTYKATGGAGGGGSVGGALSSQAQAVFDNPGLLNNFTPTVKGNIIKELAAAGKDVSRFGLQNLGGSQREQVALFDEIENEAKYAQGLFDKGVNTGVVAGPLGRVGQVFGTTGSDFTNLNSAISNMGSILLRMRSGAAVTPQEFERIRGFIPTVNEAETTAKDKIARFYTAINEAKQNYINRQTQSTYQLTQGQQGFNAPGAAGVGDPMGIR